MCFIICSRNTLEIIRIGGYDIRTRNIKRLTTFIVAVFLSFVKALVYVVNAQDAGGTNVWNPGGFVPASAKEYVSDSLPEIMAAAVCFARDIKNDDSIDYDLKLGAPYIIYNFDEYQDEIYYYPLLEDGKTEFLLAVIGTEGGYVHELSMGGEMIYLLNELDYPDSEVLFYVIDGELCYETKNSGERNLDTSAVYRSGANLDADELSFLTKSYEEKSRIISDKISNFKAVTPVKTDTESFDNLRFGKIIPLRSPQRQYNTEMCWACVVANIVNTLSWTYYTGYDICNRMGIGFYSGGDIEDMKLALSYYSVDYRRTDDCISWENMKRNIDWDYPVAVLTVDTAGYKTGPTVTLMGYEQGKKYSENYMYFWDSVDGKNKDTEALKDLGDNYHKVNYGEYIFFVKGDKAYQWIQTLSMY